MYYVLSLGDKLGIAGLALSLLTAIVVPTVRYFMKKNNIKERIEKFIRLYNTINIKRPKLLEEQLKNYDHNYECIDVEAGLAIYKSWHFTNDTPIPLDSVKVNIVAAPTIKKPIMKEFPLKKTFAENLEEYVFIDDRKTFYNGGQYMAAAIDFSNGCTLDVFKAGWYDYFDTGKVLEFESVCNQNKLRSALNPFELTNRYVAIGINSITIFRNVIDKDGNKKNYFLIHNRTKGQVAGKVLLESPNMIHVIPAGSMQPVDDKFDCNLANTIYREFFEELFNFEEMDDLAVSDIMKAMPMYQEIDDLSDNYLLGVGIEPMTTKMEVLAAIVFDMDKIKDGKFLGVEPTLEQIKTLFKPNFEGTIEFREFTQPMIRQILHRQAVPLTAAGRGVLYYTDKYFDFLNK